MNYNILCETIHVRDISDPAGGTMRAVPAATAAMPATRYIHAVRTADRQVMCTYTPKDEDVADPDRDWASLRPGEPSCDDCTNAIALAEQPASAQ